MKSLERLKITLPLGFVLGILCIIGVGSRIGLDGNEIFLIGMLYNRIVMGLVIGLDYEITLIKNNIYNSIIRGFLFGLLITTTILLSSEFKDILSFFAGLAYGIILDVTATYYTEDK